MIFQLKRLERNTEEIRTFHDKFCANLCYDIPKEYFHNSDCFALFWRGNMAAGFCLRNAPPLHLRTIVHIPDILFNWHRYEGLFDDLCEVTGQFVEDKRFCFILALYFLWTVLFYKARQFVYSYSVSQQGLEHYCSKGKPVRLHTGIPIYLQGIKGVEAEHVEMVTKAGIYKIFLYRAFRYLTGRK